MSAALRQLAVTVVLSGLAGFFGAWAGSALFRPGSSAMPPLRAAVDELAHDGIVGITTQQQQQIRDVEQRYAQRRRQLRARIGEANDELADALAEGKGFSPDVDQSITQLQAQVGELQKQAVQYVLEIRAVLTPVQQTVFDQKVVAALMSAPPGR